MGQALSRNSFILPCFAVEAQSLPLKRLCHPIKNAGMRRLRRLNGGQSNKPGCHRVWRTFWLTSLKDWKAAA
jgi:hypothetical protein